MALSLEAQEADYQELEYHSEEEWLRLRRPFWNASLAGALFNEHEYVTLGDAVTEMLRPEFEIVDEDRAKLFRRGIAMEPYIADMAVDLLEEQFGGGWRLVPATWLYVRGVMAASPDRLVLGRPDVGVELKSTRLYLRGTIKRYWWWQCQAQMWCCDWERVIIAALDATLEVQLFEVWRDEDAIRQMMRAAEEILSYVSWGNLPPGVELSADNVQTMWPKDSGETVELGADLAGPLADYIRWRAAEKEAKGFKEQARDRCVAELGPDSIATIAETPVFTYKASKDVDVVDKKALLADPDLPAELLAKHTRTKAGPRTFRLNDKGAAAVVAQMGDNDARPF